MGLGRDQEHAAVILLSSGAGRISLAGGAALIVHGLVDRPTQDLDAFSGPDGDIPSIASSAVTAFEAAGYSVTDISDSEGLRTFLVARRRRKLLGRPPQPVKVQIGRDYQLLPSVPSPVGATLDPVELAANKVLTVYDRPRGRDADDLSRLIPRFGLGRILEVADRKQVQPMDRDELAAAFRLFRRLGDREFPVPGQVASVKRYMEAVALAVTLGREPADVGPYSVAAQPNTRRQAPSPPFDQRWAPQPRVQSPPRRGICGAPTSRGGPCRNPAGGCPHHG